MRRNEGGEKWKKEREGQGGGHVQSDPGDPERLADKLHARPLGSLPLTQLPTGISLPTTLPTD